MPTGEASIDPPTAASFTILRIDRLTEGESEVELGRRLEAVRFHVENTSAHAAIFRAQIDVSINLARETSRLSRVVEDGWRRAYDRLMRGGSPADDGEPRRN
jgi:hypothetical protein